MISKLQQTPLQEPSASENQPINEDQITEDQINGNNQEVPLTTGNELTCIDLSTQKPIQ